MASFYPLKAVILWTMAKETKHFYMKFVHREGNEVHTCYVADYFGDVGVMEGPTPGRIQELETQDREKAAAIETTVNQIFKTNNINGTFERLVAREVWHKILEHAQAVKANMIVMGSRGMGKVRRTILGSVSDSVLHHAHIPVLICKHPDEQQHK
ncbi:uncharacterized protein LOC101845692 isoform X1 [Aplysia californica]|uniref:Uncharacterized protein LOC101845692 isoform X1 n=2 Tax=Aplysia californica TaxID=6500 RepID=A0ABM0JQ20_APLCA|nr:uncharacterized protein LOC101845692 isoform X1 [Aplysia californica]